MFLRWQMRPSKATKYGKRWLADRGTIWSAVLVESVRVNGRPRQRHVAYLGTITESGISKVCVRGWYWDRLTQRLDGLSNRILPEDRQRIEAAFAKRVPPITKEQHDECERGFKAWRDGLRAFAASRPRRRRLERAGVGGERGAKEEASDMTERTT
jgi:hypothetical protein